MCADAQGPQLVTALTTDWQFLKILSFMNGIVHRLYLHSEGHRHFRDRPQAACQDQLSKVQFQNNESTEKTQNNQRHPVQCQLCCHTLHTLCTQFCTRSAHGSSGFTWPSPPTPAWQSLTLGVTLLILYFTVGPEEQGIQSSDSKFMQPSCHNLHSGWEHRWGHQASSPTSYCGCHHSIGHFTVHEVVYDTLVWGLKTQRPGEVVATGAPCAVSAVYWDCPIISNWNSTYLKNSKSMCFVLLR